MEYPASAPLAGTESSTRRLNIPRRLSNPRWRPLTEGAPVLVPLLAAGMAAGFAYRPLAPIALAVAGAVAFAFRDPERQVRPQRDVAFSPADGRVIHVGMVYDEYWETELVEVAIFLALWDVHVQRAPLDGEVVAQVRKAGGYRPAMSTLATHGNNQLATHLRTAAGPVTVTQISGMVARRIVTWAEQGDHLIQGERLGMIKFGSQVTLRLPESCTVLVDVGDGVRGGLTPIARVAAVPV